MSLGRSEMDVSLEMRLDWIGLDWIGGEMLM